MRMARSCDFCLKNVYSAAYSAVRACVSDAGGHRGQADAANAVSVPRSTSVPVEIGHQGPVEGGCGSHGVFFGFAGERVTFQESVGAGLAHYHGKYWQIVDGRGFEVVHCSGRGETLLFLEEIIIMELSIITETNVARLSLSRK